MARPLPLAALIAGGVGVSLAGFAVAQTTTPGASQTPTKTARIITDLEFNDNYDLRTNSLGNAAIFTTTFGYAMQNQTPTDNFIADVQGSARASHLPSIGTDYLLDDPRLLIGYGRTVDDSTLAFNLNFRQADLDFFDPLSDLYPDGSFDDTLGTGTRQLLTANFAAAINQNGPISFDLDASTLIRNYEDTTDSSLYDREDYALSGEFGFRINPLLLGTVGAGIAYEFDDNSQQTERTTTRVDTGFDAQVNQRMIVRLRIGYSEVYTDQRSGTATETGVIGSLGFTATEIYGETRGSVSSRLDENGIRHDFSVGKLIRWRASELDGDIGVSLSEFTDASLIGDLAYRRVTPSGQVRAAFSQRATTDSESNNVIYTVLNLGYTKQVNPLSAIDLSLIGALTRYEDKTLADKERVTAAIQYNRTLARDWTSFVSYRHELRQGSTDASSNSIFVGLQRNFSSIR